MPVFHCASHKQLICVAVKRGAETLMSSLFEPAVGFEVEHLGAWGATLWVVGVAALQALITPV